MYWDSQRTNEMARDCHRRERSEMPHLLIPLLVKAPKSFPICPLRLETLRMWSFALKEQRLLSEKEKRRHIKASLADLAALARTRVHLPPSGQLRGL